MRRALGILLALLCPSPAAPAAMQKADERQSVFSFVVATDIRQGEDTRDIIGEVLDRLNGAPNKPSFIVALGDLTAGGSSTEFDSLKNDAKRAADGGITLYAVPGSKDVNCMAEGKERFVRTFNK